MYYLTYISTYLTSCINKQDIQHHLHRFTGGPSNQLRQRETGLTDSRRSCRVRRGKKKKKELFRFELSPKLDSGANSYQPSKPDQ